MPSAPRRGCRWTLKPRSNADRSERRLVAHAEADRAAQLAEIDVGRRARTRCRCRRTRRRCKPPRDRRAQLGVEDHQAVAADRKPVAVERVVGCGGTCRMPSAIEREAADRGVAAGEEALARRQVAGIASSSGPVEAGRHARAARCRRRRCRFVRGSVAEHLRGEERLRRTRPRIRSPAPRAGRWRSMYSPDAGSTGSSRVSRIIDAENDDSRNCGNSRSISG